MSWPRFLGVKHSPLVPSEQAKTASRYFLFWPKERCVENLLTADIVCFEGQEHEIFVLTKRTVCGKSPDIVCFEGQEHEIFVFNLDCGGLD